MRDYLIQPQQDLIHLLRGHQLCPFQSFYISFASSDVSIPHSLVILHRGIELLHDRVDVSHETASPKFISL